MQFRQGDVWLERVDAKPTGTPAKAEAGRLILAHGEATGHHHSVAAGSCDLLEGTERHLVVKRKAKLVHQEHATIVLDPGVYRIRHQREYSPEAIRNVRD